MNTLNFHNYAGSWRVNIDADPSDAPGVYFNLAITGASVSTIIPVEDARRIAVAIMDAANAAQPAPMDIPEAA